MNQHALARSSCLPVSWLTVWLTVWMGFAGSSPLHGQGDTQPLAEVAGHLATAVESSSADPTLANRIRTATWRLLLAEMATDLISSAGPSRICFESLARSET